MENVINYTSQDKWKIKATELLNKLNGGEVCHYTKDERKIGDWIDGKPLYEKTVTFDGNYYGNVTLQPLGISGIDSIWISQGFCIENNTPNNILTIPYIGGSLEKSVSVTINGTNKNSLSVQIGSAYSSSNSIKNITVTLQYTKTS